MTITASAESIEAAIDVSWREHPLVRRPFGEAMAHLMLAAELRVFGAQVLAKQDLSITITAITNALKHAVSWIYSGTARLPPAAMSKDALKEGNDFLENAIAYTAVVAAYSFARRNFIDLDADGSHLRASLPADDDARYDAYDLLVLPTVELGRFPTSEVTERLRVEIEKCLDRKFDRRAIPTTRNVLRAAVEVSAAYYDSMYQLPDNWRFATFTLGDFRLVTTAIRGVLGAWQVTNQLAVAYGITQYPVQLCVVRAGELLRATVDVTQLPKRRVQRIFDLLTYGRDVPKNPDPALQPLIEIVPDTLVLNSALITGGAPERNLLALINAIPPERSRYDSLKNEKESLMRGRLLSRLPEYVRAWHGRVPNRPDLPDVDCALIDDSTRSILMLELKWFVGPAEPREIADRERDLQKGVAQATQLLDALDRPTLERMYGCQFEHISAAVISANAIGSARVQDPRIPIVNEEHLLRKLAVSESLASVIDWLARRMYLPRPDLDFRHHFNTVRFFDWTVGWYGLEAVQKDDFLPL